MMLRKIVDDDVGSVIPVLMYIVGLGVFGFVYWLLNGILSVFVENNVYKAGNVWDLLNYFWVGIIIVYLIFGGIWMIRKYNEKEYIEF